MKFFYVIVKIITLITISKCYKTFHHKDLLINVNDNFYSQFTNANNYHSFENMLFKQLEEGHSHKIDNKTIYNQTLSKDNSSFMKYRYLTNTREEMRIYMGDYLSVERNIKFYIEKSQECSVYINDFVRYEKLSNINFVEHMVLHNNGESVEPKGVFSKDVDINFYAFNKKLNIFSVYFENPKDNTNFTIEFDYVGKNLLKSVIEPVKKKRIISNRMKKTQFFEHPTKDTPTTPPTIHPPIKNSYNNSNHVPLNKSNNSHHNNQQDFNNITNHNTVENFNPVVHHHNWFIWKLLNQNFMKMGEKVKIEVYFQLGKEFENSTVLFSFNFTKSIEHTKRESIVKYVWEGEIPPQQLMILDVKFPLFFESCGNLHLSWVMILIGSLFIIFLITMLHMILSTIFFEDF